MSETLSRDDLRRASTVAVVVHGVGDHSTVDILKAAEQGFRSTLPTPAGDGIQTQNLDVQALVSPGAPGMSLSALRITAGTQQHLVIAVVWSGLRDRLSRAILSGKIDSEIRPIAPAHTGIFLFQIGWRVLKYVIPIVKSHAWSVVKHIAETPFQARPFLWRAATAVVCAMVLFALAVWCAAAVSVPLAVMAIGVLRFHPSVWFWVLSNYHSTLRELVLFKTQFGYWTLEDMEKWCDSWEHVGIAIFIAAAVSFLLAIATRIFDLIADVAAFVTDRYHRERLLGVIRQILAKIEDEQSDGRVMLVGHSLGSVAVTKAIDGASCRKPILLVTLGSPLKLMARVFPGVVDCPAAFMARYREAGTLECWLHAYRDSDIIGRSLGAVSEMGYIECGLGDGPHWNYFSDPRLWNKLIALLRACPNRDYEIYRREIADEVLDRQEQRELLALQVITGLSILFPPLALLTIRTLCLSYLFAPYSRSVLGATITVLGYVLAAAAGMATLHIATLLNVIFASSLRTEGRQRIRILRFWRLPLIALPTLQLVLVAVSAELVYRHL